MDVNLNYNKYPLKATRLANGNSAVCLPGEKGGVLVYPTEDGWKPVEDLSHLQTVLAGGLGEKLETWNDKPGFFRGGNSKVEDHERRHFREVRVKRGVQEASDGTKFNYMSGENFGQGVVAECEGYLLPVLSVPYTVSRVEAPGHKMIPVPGGLFPDARPPQLGHRGSFKFDELMRGEPSGLGQSSSTVEELSPTSPDVQALESIKIDAVLQKGALSFESGLRSLAPELSNPTHQGLARFGAAILSDCRNLAEPWERGEKPIEPSQAAYMGATMLRALKKPIRHSLAQVEASLALAFAREGNKRHHPIVLSTLRQIGDDKRNQGAAYLAQHSLKEKYKPVHRVALETIASGEADVDERNATISMVSRLVQKDLNVYAKPYIGLFPPESPERNALTTAIKMPKKQALQIIEQYRRNQTPANPHDLIKQAREIWQTGKVQPANIREHLEAVKEFKEDDPLLTWALNQAPSDASCIQGMLDSLVERDYRGATAAVLKSNRNLTALKEMANLIGPAGPEGQSLKELAEISQDVMVVRLTVQQLLKERQKEEEELLKSSGD